MEGTTFLFLVLSGLWFLPVCFPTYILVEIALTWAEAQHYCRENHQDLASYHNQEELEELVVTAKPYHNGHVWIGLYDDINSWTWSAEQENNDGEEEAEFWTWNTGEPNNWSGYQNCVAINGGPWSDLSCNYQEKFACYNETEGSFSFIFVNEDRTWNEAQSYCREHYTDLAKIRNQAENDQIMQMSQNQKTWIGLYRDSWKWSDGSPPSFTNWHTGNNEPNGNITTPCGLLHQGQWEDEYCGVRLYFVCNIASAKRRVLKVKVSVKDSSMNLEDAAEAIMQKFSKTLKDHSLTEDMKLTWRKQPDGNIFHVEEKKEESDQLQP